MMKFGAIVNISMTTAIVPVFLFSRKGIIQEGWVQAVSGPSWGSVAVLWVAVHLSRCQCPTQVQEHLLLEREWFLMQSRVCLELFFSWRGFLSPSAVRMHTGQAEDQIWGPVSRISAHGNTDKRQCCQVNHNFMYFKKVQMNVKGF